MTEEYRQYLAYVADKDPYEMVGELRRSSIGFARGLSQYRGVSRHHLQGRWEARVGRVNGNKYAYLGTYDTAEDAARAYDRAAVKYKGAQVSTAATLTPASTSFRLSIKGLLHGCLLMSMTERSIA